MLHTKLQDFPIFFFLLYTRNRGGSQNMSASKEGGGLQNADNGWQRGEGGKANADNGLQRGEGSKANADICWQRGAGVLATNDITDKMTNKYHYHLII